MPCDTIQLSKVTFSLENTNESLLIKAMENMGFTHQGNMQFIKGQMNATFKDGQMTTQTYGSAKLDQAELKRQYSTEVVKFTARKFGWKLKEKSKGKFQVVKGY